jgi:cell division protein FtsW
LTRKHSYALFFLLTIVTALSIFGLVMLYSTTAAIYGEQKLKQQSMWIIIGIIAALMIHKLDYRRLGSMSHIFLFLISLPLFYLATVHLMAILGVSKSILSTFPFIHKGAIKGAYRWLTIGDRTIQPSEFAKLIIIMYLARYYGTNPRYAQSFKRGVLRPMLIVGGVMFGILSGGSFSVTVITGGVVMGILFVAGIRLRYFLALFTLGGILFTTVVLISPVRATRLISFQNPEKYKDGVGYQLYSSQLALGSGAWFGVGFNRSRMKELYLPEAHTDFIMAIVGEELGFVTMAAVMALYLSFVAVAFVISATAIDREGMLLAFGIGLSVGLHALINIGVVSGFVPTTGITAPLISYGGSSMLMTWLSIGLLWAVIRTSQINTQPRIFEPKTGGHFFFGSKAAPILSK